MKQAKDGLSVERKRRGTAFLKIASVLTAGALLCAAGACKKDNVINEGKIYDFYREVEFELPFESKNYSYAGVLNFDTDLSMAQMAEKTKSAGYGADLYDFDGVQRLFVTSEKDGGKSYFLIYDKTLSEARGNGESDRYTLSGLSGDFQADGKRYAYLFPLQFAEAKDAEITSESPKTERKKVYCTFNEFAEFYRGTGKNDVTVDETNRTVTFSCKASTEQNGTDVNLSAGEILLSYVETENGNYAEIRLK